MYTFVSFLLYFSCFEFDSLIDANRDIEYG
jgi:hypothetical protein